MPEHEANKMLFYIQFEGENEGRIRDALSRVDDIFVSPSLGVRTVYSTNEQHEIQEHTYPEIRGVCGRDSGNDIVEMLCIEEIDFREFKKFDPSNIDPSHPNPMNDSERASLIIDFIRQRMGEGLSMDDVDISDLDFDTESN